GAHEGALVNIPQNASVANVTVYKKGNTWWSASDTYTYDLRSEKCSFKRLQNDKTLGMKWRDSNYDIHVGKIAGRTGMWIAFVTSLICASLPVTGFYIWYGRKFKKKKRRS
ncbi:PepSY-associated TM helix domain-containing protein, partial [Sphingobacterium sp.]|uniref:PepSY-associated TM helix domain-containing protein n=1 Tax=Sphingobacterium sp. TaxID=341027 RepID=UPI002899373D